MDQVIHARWWRVPADEVPDSGDREAQVQWLYDWWERIDRWIAARRSAGAEPPVRACGAPAQSPAQELRGAVLRLDTLLDEQPAQAFDLVAEPVQSLGDGGKI
jgi:hypothetical protein